MVQKARIGYVLIRLFWIPLQSRHVIFTTSDFDMEYYKYPNFVERFRWEYSWQYGYKR